MRTTLSGHLDSAHLFFVLDEARKRGTAARIASLER